MFEEGMHKERNQTAARIRKWKFEGEDSFSDTAFSR
jgi:hypothetical protein